ncbi:MAG: ankyrin repeat domain-containing protein [Rhodobacteraceae bacterium]|nr:ankyrin repeat domain-containing protein [Paracoccaceae bacterium]
MKISRRALVFISLIASLPLLEGCLAPRFYSLPLHSAPIEDAVASDNIQRVKHLLENGGDANARNRAGTPLLHIAARENRTAITKLLLEKGAQIEAVDRNGLTALHEAAYFGALGAAYALVGAGARIDAVTLSGMRPLNYSIVNKHSDITHLLRANGATLSNITIRVGSDLLLLSTEAQQYLAVMSQGGNELPKSIIIIGEPHQHQLAQWQLYRGLKIFFRDNPKYANRVVFLAEGLARNSNLPMESLIEAEPRPSTCTIRIILDSFLIPGYVAYEWETQRGINIVGVEDSELYQTSVALHLSKKEIPRLSVQVSRNKSMAETAIWYLDQSTAPMLFIGGGHLERADPNAYQRSRLVASTVLSSSTAKRVDDAQNLGVSDHLAASSVGFVYFESGVGNWNTVRATENQNYKTIFSSQASETYDAYVRSFVGDLSKKAPMEGSNCD